MAIAHRRFGVYGEGDTPSGGARDATRHARPAATAACSAPVGHSRGAWADAGRAPRGPARDTPCRRDAHSVGTGLSRSAARESGTGYDTR